MIRRRLLLAAAAACPAGAARAQPAPREILRVTGLIDPAHGPAGVGYDLPGLEALGTVEATTETAWTTGPQRFSGVPLRRLLDAVGARGDRLLATALNDYRIAIPAEDAGRHAVLLATRLSGEPMRVRDRGPIWVIYPGLRPGPEAMLLNERQIWQLRRIEVA